MTRWTIDGRGDTGTRAIHHAPRTGRLEFNSSRMPSGFWLADVTYPDGSTHHIDASAPSGTSGVRAIRSAGAVMGAPIDREAFRDCERFGHEWHREAGAGCGRCGMVDADRASAEYQPIPRADEG